MKLTDEELKQLEKEFPKWSVPPPDTCTAYWDFNSWRKWIAAHYNKDKKLYYWLYR